MASELVPIPVPPSSPAVWSGPDDVVDAWLAGRSPRTLRAYAGDLDHFARFVGADSGGSAVDYLLNNGHGQANACVLGYRGWMTGLGLAAATIARRLAALRSVVKCARMLGRTTWSLDVEAPKAAKYRDTRGPGLDGWRRMVDRAKGDGDTPKARRDRALIRLLHDRALRRGEAVGLDLADVDLAEATVEVLGKGRSQTERLTIGEPTVKALREWIESRGPDPGPLFIRLDPGGQGQRLTGEGVRLIVGRLAEGSGIDRRVRPHGLRHGAITESLDRGDDIRHVMKFSRHKDMKTLMIYDDSREDAGGDIAKKFEE
jgi:integrase/recombinase XerC